MPKRIRKPLSQMGEDDHSNPPLTQSELCPRMKHSVLSDQPCQPGWNPALQEERAMKPLMSVLCVALLNRAVTLSLTQCRLSDHHRTQTHRAVGGMYHPTAISASLTVPARLLCEVHQRIVVLNPKARRLLQVPMPASGRCSVVLQDSIHQGAPIQGRTRDRHFFVLHLVDDGGAPVLVQRLALVGPLVIEVRDLDALSEPF